jgi:DNA-binding response OmpR family regulator
MRILIVEDEKRMAALLKKGLEEEQHSVTVTHNGLEGLEIALQDSFDAIVLDIMLPGIDGLEMAKRLRDRGNRIPILMLTARDDVPDIVRGLDAGADDYITKPFSFEEFFARLRAVSRRGPIPQSPLLQVGDLIMDPAAHTVSRSNHSIVLTKKEYQLLELLMRHQGRVLSRTSIIDTIWGSGTLKIIPSTLSLKSCARRSMPDTIDV